MIYNTNFEKPPTEMTTMHLNQINDRFSSFHACTGPHDSPGIMKGTLVLIQNSSSPSPSVTSPLPPRPASQRFPLQTPICEGSPQARGPKRLLVAAKVFRQNGKHFAIVSFVSRHQSGLAPLYLNLRKYRVRHEAGSRAVSLYSLAMEGTCLTLEATNPGKAWQWAQALDGQGQGQGRDSVHQNVPGDHQDKGLSANVLERISEESSDEETTTTTTTTATTPSSIPRQRLDNTGMASYNTTQPMERSRNSLTKPPRASSPSQVFGVSRRPPLPVLSESEETDEEMSIDSDNECFLPHRLD